MPRPGTRPLGLAAGDTRHQMLGLRTHGDVTLVVADTAVALADLIDFEHGAYVLDTAAIRHLVDAAMTADPRYTRRARRGARPTRSTRRRGYDTPKSKLFEWCRSERMRKYILMAGVGLHVGIYVTMAAPFFTWMAMYAVFVDFESLRRWVVLRNQARHRQAPPLREAPLAGGGALVR